MLEPYALKGARTVLRGGGEGNLTSLPDPRALLASPEYYRRNGKDEAKFIGALFRDLARRNPVHPEGSNWLTRLKQLKGDRARFIEAFRSHYRV
jgi:hypothetical protein